MPSWPVARHRAQPSHHARGRRCRRGSRSAPPSRTWRSERATETSSGKSTMRGSGHHQRTGVAAEPREDAVPVRVDEALGREVARRPPAARSDRRARASSGGKGVRGPSQGITRAILPRASRHRVAVRCPRVDNRARKSLLNSHAQDDRALPLGRRQSPLRAPITIANGACRSTTIACCSSS